MSAIKEEIVDQGFRSDRQALLAAIIRMGGRMSEPDMAKEFKERHE